MTWENLDKSRPDSAHYSVIRLVRGEGGMTALRKMFPDAKANELSFVLFSTSGVHGTYNAIEEAEKAINGEDPETYFNEVTFVVVHPRLVAMRYGVCNPETHEDIDFLKRLRASSHKAVAGIGQHEPSASLPAAEDAPKIGPLTLAAIGRNHFGNPIPQEWYAAAKELLAMRAAEDARDKDRLDWLATEYIKVDPFEMPTGGGDADVGWRFSQYHCGKPREVVVHEHYKDDLREAIDAAMSQDSGKENGE